MFLRTATLGRPLKSQRPEPAPSGRPATARTRAHSNDRQIQFVCKIGSGGNGEVFLAKMGRIPVVVKMATRPPADIRADALKEGVDIDSKYGTAAEFDHLLKAHEVAPHLVPHPLHLIHSPSESQQPIIVQQHIRGITVDDIIQLHRSQRSHIPLQIILEIARDLCRGLDLIKKRAQLVHRDIKPANVLIGTAGQVVLVDFGTAKSIDETDSNPELQNTIAILTQKYAAPERFECATHANTDIYSIGLSMMEMILVSTGGSLPAKSINQDRRSQVIERVIEALQTQYQLPEQWLKNFRRLFENMTAQDPADRGSLETAHRTLDQYLLAISLSNEISVRDRMTLRDYAERIVTPFAEAKLQGQQSATPDKDLPANIDLSTENLAREVLTMMPARPATATPIHKLGGIAVITTLFLTGSLAVAVSGLWYLSQLPYPEYDEEPAIEPTPGATATALTEATDQTTQEIVSTTPQITAPKSVSAKKITVPPAPPAHSAATKQPGKTPPPITISDEPLASEPKPKSEKSPHQVALRFSAGIGRVLIDGKNVANGSSITAGFHNVRVIRTNGDIETFAISLNDTQSNFTLE